MSSLLKNVVGQNFTFCLVSATTGLGVAGATVSGFVTKDGGAQASTSGTITSQGNGQYNYSPTQAETNAVDVGFFFTATGCVPVNLDFHTYISSAAGYFGVDWTTINGATATVNFSNTTIGSVSAATVLGTSPLTESYAAQGASLTLAQALYGLTQQLGAMSISGTTMTVLKRDNATTAKTYTLNSGTVPTSITEAT